MFWSKIFDADEAVLFSQMESDIAFFAKALNEAPIARYFTRAADLRRRAFEAILWNESRGQWLDYWLPLQKPSAKVRKVIIYIFSVEPPP